MESLQTAACKDCRGCDSPATLSFPPPPAAGWGWGCRPSPVCPGVDSTPRKGQKVEVCCIWSRRILPYSLESVEVGTLYLYTYPHGVEMEKVERHDSLHFMSLLRTQAMAADRGGRGRGSLGKLAFNIYRNLLAVNFQLGSDWGSVCACVCACVCVCVNVSTNASLCPLYWEMTE